MMSDGTPTELSHGSHSPARADTFDMLHREKNLLSNITGRRLEPFNQDVEDQVSHLLAKIITPPTSAFTDCRMLLTFDSIVFRRSTMVL